MTRSRSYMRQNSETVLVVDDEVSDRELMRSTLQRAGYLVIEAADYDSAEAALAARNGAVDLLVADVSLPGNNGCELASAARKRYPRLKVLFVSGHTGAEICKFYGFPVSDRHFLGKPFEAPAFRDRVREVLDCKEALPELAPLGSRSDEAERDASASERTDGHSHS